MNRTWLTMMGAGIGASVMYYLDPNLGRRRRALARDKVAHGVNQASRGLDVAGRDVANRARGLAAQARSRLRDEPVADEVLVERVRARIGRLVSHPGAIEVAACDGIVTLSGPILQDEVRPLLHHVRRVPGVRYTENCLTEYTEPGRIPGLQGEAARGPGAVFEYFQDRWSPAARLVAGLAGGALGAYGASRRNSGGAALLVTGLGLLARSAANKPITRLVGMEGQPQVVDLHKSIDIAAPVERVFEVWSGFEHFPEMTAHVLDVKRLDELRSRWTVAGPLGGSFQWDATLTDLVPGCCLSWETGPSAAVQHTGMVHFESLADGRTRVDLRMRYCPVAGVAGNLAAALLRADPARWISEDLTRIKTFIETGKYPHDAARKVTTVESGAAAGGTGAP